MLNFYSWLENQGEMGNLDIVDDEFQTNNQVPPTITIPGGTSLPNGAILKGNVEYQVSVVESDSENRPVILHLKLIKAPFGKNVINAPDEFKLSWKQFQLIWGGLLSTTKQNAGQGLDNIIGGKPI